MIDKRTSFSFGAAFFDIKNGAVYAYDDSSVVIEETIREIYHVEARIIEPDGNKVVLI